MKITHADTPRLVLNWVLRQGREILNFQVHRTGEQYRVSVQPAGRRKRLYAKLLRGGTNAFHLHAALVAGFRDAGWTSVAYR